MLFALAKEIGALGALFANKPEPGSALLSALERLAEVDESVVRDMAVASAGKLLTTSLDAAAAKAVALPIVRRLAAGKWFTLRVSACGLVAPLYAKVRRRRGTPPLLQCLDLPRK